VSWLSWWWRSGPPWWVNRQVVVVRAKEPFVEWINRISASEKEPTQFSLAEVNRDPHTFLIPHFDCVADAHEYLVGIKPLLFEMLLGGWYGDPELWPEDRTSEVFDEWFEVSIHTGVVDLAFERFKRERYG
jgi:hypothetical protein